MIQAISPRCEPPTPAQVEMMQEAVDDILKPAIFDVLKLLGDQRLTLDAILSAYVNFGVLVEGAAGFAETLQDVVRVVPPHLPALEADLTSQGRA